MGLPKRDGVNGRCCLIHKPDTGPEVREHAGRCIQDILDGTARESHSGCPVHHVGAESSCPKKRAGTKSLRAFSGGMCSGSSGERIPGIAAERPSRRRQRNGKRSTGRCLRKGVSLCQTLQNG